MKLNLLYLRVLACRNRSEQRLAMYMGYLGIALILVFSLLAGLIMFAKYECCDPLTAGWIDLPVQKKQKVLLSIGPVRTRVFGAMQFASFV